MSSTPRTLQTEACDTLLLPCLLTAYLHNSLRDSTQ
jgi:hypothetical protein